MKYFVVEVATVDGTAAKQLYEKSTLNEALMQFHQARASALANPKVTYAMSLVMDETGNVYTKEYNGSTKEA